MKKYSKNNRIITDTQREKLKKWLSEFGDLGCIVHNINTDEIICGNQRINIIKINKQDIIIEKEYPEPTRQGTIAEGYFFYSGERFKYRQVNWNEDKAARACIISNKSGGDFDYKNLLFDFELDELWDFGFKEFEFNVLIKKKNI